MSNARVLVFDISDIPDPQDRMLAAACGGDVRAKACEAASQVLRAISTLPPGQTSCSLRLSFDPNQPRQSRQKIQVLLGFGEGSEMEAVMRKIMLSGPLEPIFRPKLAKTNDEDSADVDFEPFGAVCEIVRREDIWSHAKELKDLNNDVPSHYYRLTPFQPIPDNDWSAVDRLLDRFDRPALVDVVVTPAEVSPERAAHYGLVKVLMNVNYTGSDLSAKSVNEARRGVERDHVKMRDPIADELLREHEDLQRTLREPHMHFSVRCFAGSEEESRLLGSAVAESCLGEGKYRLLIAKSEDTEAWDAVLAGCRDLQPTDGFDAPEVWRVHDLKAGTLKLKRLSRLAPPTEIEGFFRLPVSRPGAPPRTAKGRHDPKPLKEKERRTNILIGDDLELGGLAERAFAEGDEMALEGMFTGDGTSFPELRLPIGLLRKHIFIAGVPGSGKTTAMFNILTQLAHLDDPIPFLVIEPAKTEYRTLKDLRVHPDPQLQKLARELKVYTVGSEEGSPFRFNPMAYPEGISLDEHIGALLSCFDAAMPMGGPLQGLLAEAVEAVYENPPEGSKFPRLKDLLRTARQIVDRKGYEGEVLGNLKAALDVRLGLLVRRSLGKVFDCDESVPSMEELFESNVVLEMDYLTSNHACLMSLFVLSSLREHIRVTRASGAPLTHVTILEEAHNIVGRSGAAQASEDAADPKAFAAQYVSQMLAELRALGEGIIIADQLPSAVAPEVIKNTGTKLAHRMVANQDREDLGGTMLLDEAGMEELARLQPGEAFFFSESTYRPRRCRGLPTHLYMGMGQPNPEDGEAPEMPQPPGKKRFMELVQDEEWFRDGCRARLRQLVRDSESAREELAEACEKARSSLEKLRLRLPDAAGALDDGQALTAIGEELADHRLNLEGINESVVGRVLPLWFSIDLDRMGSEGYEKVDQLRERLATEELPEARSLLDELSEEVGFVTRIRDS